MEGCLGTFGVLPWLPLAFVLCERDTVSAVLIAYTNENWLTLASDENILLFVHSDAVLGEYPDGAIVRGFADAH